MGFISQVHTAVKTTHKEVGEMSFLARYKSNQIPLVDHYMHLRQLLPVYEALERRIQSPTCTITLSDDKSFLLNRSDELRRDIAFLESRVPVYLRNWVSSQTNAYAESLNTETDDKVVFGHFLARILGDLFGGKTIKERMGRLYAKWGIEPIGEETGLAFYQFPDRTLQDLSRGLDAMTSTMDQASVAIVIAAIDNGIARHKPIFADLEKKHSEVQRYQSIRMFAGAVATAAAGAVVAFTATKLLG